MSIFYTYFTNYFFTSFAIYFFNIKAPPNKLIKHLPKSDDAKYSTGR